MILYNINMIVQLEDSGVVAEELTNRIPKYEQED